LHGSLFDEQSRRFSPTPPRVKSSNAEWGQLMTAQWRRRIWYERNVSYRLSARHGRVRMYSCS
jgi:hypothetical protein